MNWHLLVVDLQSGFAPHILQWDKLCQRAGTMIQAARRLGIPVTVTEQNPERLGATIPETAALLSDCPCFTKMTFSCLAHRDVQSRIMGAEPVNLVLVGIETHVCILQTALDALAHKPPAVTPYIPVDAVSSRFLLDKEIALRRLEREGAVLTTVESVIMEMVKEAGTDRFKAILPLVK